MSSRATQKNEKYVSQHGQDEFLDKNIFRGAEGLVFVDVGAHDGVTINNTFFFEQHRGWTGINVEPIASVFAQLEKNRPRATNVNCAVSSSRGTQEFVMNTGHTEMISGLKQFYDDRHHARRERENAQFGSRTKIVSVETRPLRDILAEHGVDRVHYLSVDVEGAEEAVVRSIDFDKVFIDVIGFENNYDDCFPLIQYLTSAGYGVVAYGPDIFMVHLDSPFRPGVIVAVDHLSS